MTDTQMDARGRVEPVGRLLGWCALLSVAFAWVFWDFLHRQVLFAVRQQADWGHTLVIPFIAGWFIWLKRDRIFANPLQASWSGLFVLLLGLAWYSICALGPTTLHHHNLMGVGVAMAITGLAIFIFGWRAMRWMWFPLIYLIVFGQTISDRFMEVVTFKLQDIAAVGSFHGLSILGLDLTRSGNTLEIFYDGTSHPLNIAEACSGMRMLMAFFALGVAMAATSLQFTWQRVLLVAMALPTAVFVNILRVMTLGLLSLADSGFAAGDFHTFVGTLWLLPAFFIYMGVVWLLRNLVIDEGASGGSSMVDGGGRPIFAEPVARTFTVAVLLLAASAAGLQVGVQQLNIYLHKDAVYPRKDLSTIPVVAGRWIAMDGDMRLDAAAVEALGTDRYLSRVYKRREEGQGTARAQVHLAYYTGQIDAVPHVPDRCMVAGGYVPHSAEPHTLFLDVDKSAWSTDPEHELAGEPYRIMRVRDSVTGRVETVRMPQGDFELRTTEFSHPTLADVRIFAGYFFVANGRTTAYPERIRLLAFDRAARHAYYCKVQFTIHGDASFDEQQFIALTSELVSELLPEIMQCLPDWVEVTTGGDDEKNRG